jgi:GNAT superfamily N-acetyltransferase
MLADDVFGETREQPGDPLDRRYVDAFEAIEADPRNRLVVADDGGSVVGTLQLTYVPALSHRGGERAQLESVRVVASRRGEGLGRQLVEWAVEQARLHGCSQVQLTTDARRIEARRFYEGLGFTASHVGMKLWLRQA